MSFAHKRMGTVGVRSVEPTGVYADEAKQRQKQRQDRIIARREKFVMLNKHTYPELYEKWKANGGGRLPKCKRCREYTIQWNEPAHVCDGFTPKFAEHDQEWHDRQDARREEIREAKRQKEVPTCKWCGIDLPEFDDYDAHMSDGCPEMP